LSSPLQGATIGIFGTDEAARTALGAALAKKSEAEGIIVYHRTEGGRKLSLLDTADYPGRIQGYARLASISDHAFYVFPKSGRLSPPDGELAVLLEAFGIPGTIQILDGSSSPEAAAGALRGTAVAGYPVEERSSQSSTADLSRVAPRPDFPASGALVYVDRVFSVKGVGTVALGFVLSGTVRVHDQLRPVPSQSGLRADVRGIQVNDVDFDSAGRGIRVGLSLRGVEPQDLEKCLWLDDGSFSLKDTLELRFAKSRFYKQDLNGRDLHLQVAGGMLTAKVSQDSPDRLSAALATAVPVWEGMRAALLDLNAKPLRVAGGGTLKF
jgi:selenocysteine-specific translation elongation factor